MSQQKIRAVYMRGGTSRCLVFHQDDLPPAGAARDRVLSAALGSPDSYGRQLDGLGGGISSLSKACIIGPPTLPGADVDYTFAQVDIRSPVVDYKGNCGNCSSAVGPFAIDERLVKAANGKTIVRIHNTNTKKLIVAHVPVRDGDAVVDGDFELAGVAGRGARITLDFLEPGGAGTGRLLPTGNAREPIDGVDASLVDATNPMVFVRAKGDAVDIVARVISMGTCHRASPLTTAMCLAVAARIDGTVVRECAGDAAGDLRLGHPSGVLPIDAGVKLRDGAPWAERVTVYRTARRLMEGFVRIP